MWSAGDWDTFSRHLAPLTDVVLDRLGAIDGADLLDVGTGSGTTIAIPAALRGARVTGADVTPELLEHARRHAADAGADVTWVEADAAALPFADAAYDRVVSTFGAMFAPDHARAAAELVRVCRPGGQVLMTTWMFEGFVGETFTLTGSFMPPPPEGVGLPPQWGLEDHVRDMFGRAGIADPTVTPATISFAFPSVEACVEEYSTKIGPFAMARVVLEPAGRWEEYRDGFTDLVRRFNAATDGSVLLPSSYFLIDARP